ncbi:MAG: PEP-utilizing enzyme [Ignavibacteriales bacterium]|nr:PEP-utilizing enzyme [Ignavibacteriales bacterium]
MSRELTLGVALDMGGQTSHTAILARSLGIPAVLGLRDITRQVREGEFLIVDGTDGEVIIDPPPAVRREFQAKKEKYENYGRELQKTAKLKSETLDRVRFIPQANIELPEEIALALSMGAEGVGLFRSEFIYLRRESLPTEEDHFEIYSRLARGAAPHPVTIRTLDIGGEKSLPQLNIEKEPNPALGLRAVRFSLRQQGPVPHPAPGHPAGQRRPENVRVLVPMVTEVDEILEVKDVFEDVKKGLRQARRGLRRDDPARRHDRGARGGGPGRRHAEGGRLRQHRDERPHPVLPRRRPGQRVRDPPLQAVPPGRPAGSSGPSSRRPGSAEQGRRRLRRDGRGHALGHRPAGLRPADLQHEPHLHPPDQEGPAVDRGPDGRADRRRGPEAPERPADRGVRRRGDPPPPPPGLPDRPAPRSRHEEIGSSSDSGSSLSSFGSGYASCLPGPRGTEFARFPPLRGSPPPAAGIFDAISLAISRGKPGNGRKTRK